MGRHSQSPDPVSHRRSLRAVTLLALGIVVAGYAWLYLVRAAIDFGSYARDGRTVAWLFCAGATLGAAACAVVVLLLLTRALRRLGVLRAAPRRRHSRHSR